VDLSDGAGCDRLPNATDKRHLTLDVWPEPLAVGQSFPRCRSGWIATWPCRSTSKRVTRRRVDPCVCRRRNRTRSTELGLAHHRGRRDEATQTFRSMMMSAWPSTFTSARWTPSPVSG
jgi:hypothetical protein